MDVNVKETGRVVEIKDQRGNLRYKVMMLVSDAVDATTLQVVRAYVIRVVSFYGLENPIGIYNNRLPTYEEAEADFFKQKENYTLLVKTEVRPLTDIELYAEKIKYEIVQPDVCMFCKFCHKNHHGKFECWNKENFECYLELMDNGKKNDFRRDCPPHQHPVQVFPFPEKPFDCGMKHHHCHHKEQICPHPVVDVFGHCENFKKKIPVELEEEFNQLLQGSK